MIEGFSWIECNVFVAEICVCSKVLLCKLPVWVRFRESTTNANLKFAVSIGGKENQSSFPCTLQIVVAPFPKAEMFPCVLVKKELQALSGRRKAVVQFDLP
jgi:hypothetical protein